MLEIYLVSPRKRCVTQFLQVITSDSATADAATRPDNTTAAIACSGQDYKQLVSYRSILNHCFSRRQRDARDISVFPSQSLISARPLNRAAALYVAQSEDFTTIANAAKNTA